MSNQKSRVASADAAPQRPLRADFTAYTLRHASTARRRVRTKQRIEQFCKETRDMNMSKRMRTIPGAVLTLAIIAGGSVGAYALANWFGGTVAVVQPNKSVFAVDLSGCGNIMLPGVASADKRNVKFKILGSPHISAEDLQRRLLAECELQRVYEFYGSHPEIKVGGSYPTVIKSIDDQGALLTYMWGDRTHPKEKYFTFASNMPVYNQGRKASIQDLKVGDTAIFTTAMPEGWVETTDPLALTDEVQSIFKTQYDTREAPGAAKNGFYEENNIMLLDSYNQLHR